MSNWFEWVVRRRALVTLACLGLVAALATGVTRLGFENNYKYVLSPDNPDLKSFEALEATFGKRENALFLIESNSTIFTPRTLETVRWLSTESWRIPFAKRVDSLSEYQHATASGDNIEVRPLLPTAGPLTAADVEVARDVALSEPLLRGSLVSPSGKATVVNVTLRLEGTRPGEEAPVIEAARRLVAEATKRDPDIKISLGGFVMLNHSFLEASMRDMGSLIPLMYLALFAVLGLSLRSIGAVAISLSVVMMSVVGAFGVAGWLGIPISAPSSSAPTLIMVIGVAESIHLLLGVLRLRREGESAQQSVVNAWTNHWRSMVFTTATTLIGLLGLNFSDAKPFNDLGNISGVGVVLTCLFSVTWSPVLATLLRTKKRAESKFESATTAFFRAAVTFAATRRKQVMVVSVVMMGAALFACSRNRLDDDFIDYFDSTFEFRTSSDRIADAMGGVYTMEFAIPSPSGGVASPVYLNKLDEFARWYRQQPGVSHVWSLSDVVKRLNVVAHGDDTKQYTVPEDSDLTSQYLLLYEMSLPYGAEMADRIAPDRNASRFTVSTTNLTAVQLRELSDRGTRWLQNNAPGMSVVAGSPGLMFAHLSGRNIDSMISGNAIGFGMITLFMCLVLRSVKLGVVSLFTNVIPILFGFALWALMDGRINLGLTLVADIAMGVVVDDTIYILKRYADARTKGEAVTDALVSAWCESGPAIFATSLALCVGFGVLATSHFGLNSNMALLSSITMFIAVWFDLIWLTAALVLVDSRRSPAVQRVVEVNPALSA